jgi:hypothetical protein
MTSRVEHTDVGAYALGLLDDNDRQGFEAHLNGCRACRAELAGLAEVAVTLSGADLGPTTRFRPMPVPDAGDSATVTDLMLRRATAQRRQRGRRAVLSAAAACVLIGGGVGVGVAAVSSSGGTANVSTVAMVGEKRKATDPSTGVTGTVAMESVGWGTRVGLKLGKVSGPETCQLIAVRTDGSEHVVTGWTVPNTGYGVPSHPDPLVIQGGTEISRSQIKSFDIRTNDGKTLLSIPV